MIKLLRTSRTPAALALTALLALSGCVDVKLAGGAGAGNPPQADVVLSFKANSLEAGKAALGKSSGTVLRNPDGTFTAHDTSGSALDLSAIEVQVAKIEIVLPQELDCGDIRGIACGNDEALIKGPYVMDLMTGTAVPSVDFIKLPEAIYHIIELELPTAAHGDAPGTSSKPFNIAIRGRSGNSAAAGKAFELRLNLKEELTFEDTAGFHIEPASLNNVILKLNVDAWFNGTRFAGCLEQSPPDSAGVIILEGDDFCAGEGLRIRKNIEASGQVENEELPED
jgi:hypothetical protein